MPIINCMILSLIQYIEPNIDKETKHVVGIQLLLIKHPLKEQRGMSGIQLENDSSPNLFFSLCVDYTFEGVGLQPVLCSLSKLYYFLSNCQWFYFCLYMLTVEAESIYDIKRECRWKHQTVDDGIKTGTIHSRNSDQSSKSKNSESYWTLLTTWGT